MHTELDAYGVLGVMFGFFIAVAGLLHLAVRPIWKDLWSHLRAFWDVRKIY